MSPATEPSIPTYRPSQLDRTQRPTAVTDIGPWLNRSAAPAADTGGDPWGETVILGELSNRREHYSSAPPPPRLQHRSWTLSSVLIAVAGVVAVVIAADIGELPLVGTVALAATVVCGALLVAAQLVEEVRRARNPDVNRLMG